MSARTVKVMLAFKGLAFGFLVVSAVCGRTLEQVVGFGLSALLMGAAAVLLLLSLPKPVPRVSRITLRGVPRNTVVIREKRRDFSKAA